MTAHLLNREELAERLNVSVWAIAKWRAAGYGPPAVRVGGSIRWRPEDVESWIESQYEDKAA